MTKKEIAKSFSEGKFKPNYQFLSDKLIWEIIGEGENIFSGKGDIIDYCTQIGKYFESVKTDFKTLNVIEGKSKIAVNGTAKFIRENETINFTQSCDIYEFDKDGNVEKITSYCIAKRN